MDELYNIVFGDGWRINNFNERSTPIKIDKITKAAYQVILILVDSVQNERGLSDLDIAYTVYMSIPYDAKNKTHVDVFESIEKIAGTIITVLQGFDLSSMMKIFDDKSIYATLQELALGYNQSYLMQNLQEVINRQNTLGFMNIIQELVATYETNYKSTKNAHKLRGSQASESVFKQYVHE